MFSVFRNAYQSRVFIPLLVFSSISTVFVVFVVQKYSNFGFNSKDLGIFVEIVRNWSTGAGPVSSLEGINHFQLHFSPILGVLVPLWSVWPDARMLLVAQALLVASAAIPLSLFAEKSLGRGAAIGFSAAFALSFGVSSAINYDFHEVAFAVPIIAWSLYAFAEKHYVWSAVIALLLCLVKEDFGIIYVFPLGILIFFAQKRLLGMITAASGIAIGLLTIFVVIPAFNGGGDYAFTSGLGLASLQKELDVKAATVVATFMITCFIAVRTRLVILVLLPLLERFAGSNGLWWGTGLHYSLTLMIIVVFITVIYLSEQSAAPEDQRRQTRWVAWTSVGVTFLMWLSFPMADIARPGFWNASSQPVNVSREAAVQFIPAGEKVAATNLIGARLAQTSDVVLLTGGSGSEANAKWVVLDSNGDWLMSGSEAKRRLAELKSSGFVNELFSENGVYVLAK